MNAPVYRIDALQNQIQDAIFTKLTVHVSLVRLSAVFEPSHNALARHR